MIPYTPMEQENVTLEEASQPVDTSPGHIIHKKDYDSMIQKKNTAKVKIIDISGHTETCNVQHSIDMAYMLSTVKQMRYSLALDRGGLGLTEVHAGLPPHPLRPPAAGSLGPAADRAEHLGYPPTQEVGSFIYLGAAACLETHVCRYNVGIQVMAVLVVGINVFTTGFV